jgi:hypothetical protein
VRTVHDSRTGTLNNGQSLTLPADGDWDLVFRAGSDEVRRSYGVNVTLPEVRILTDNAAPFTGSLEVAATTSTGTLYHSTDRQTWEIGSLLVLSRTATVSFIAIDSLGNASPIISRAYNMPPIERQTASLTQHFLAGRIAVNSYVAWGLELGFNAVLTLYLIDGSWVRNPVRPGDRARLAPLLSVRAVDRAGAMLTSDHASGDYPGAIQVTLRAVPATTVPNPAQPSLAVHYTEDGSDPSDPLNPNRLSFRGQKTFAIGGRGAHSLLCHVSDAQGVGSFEAYAWTLQS